jgi:hypothetical protein
VDRIIKEGHLGCLGPSKTFGALKLGIGECNIGVRASLTHRPQHRSAVALRNSAFRSRSLRLLRIKD